MFVDESRDNPEFAAYKEGIIEKQKKQSIVEINLADSFTTIARGYLSLDLIRSAFISSYPPETGFNDNDAEKLIDGLKPIYDKKRKELFKQRKDAYLKELKSKQDNGEKLQPINPKEREKSFYYIHLFEMIGMNESEANDVVDAIEELISSNNSANEQSKPVETTPPTQEELILNVNKDWQDQIDKAKTLELLNALGFSVDTIKKDLLEKGIDKDSAVLQSDRLQRYYNTIRQNRIRSYIFGDDGESGVAKDLKDADTIAKIEKINTNLLNVMTQREIDINFSYQYLTKRFDLVKKFRDEIKDNISDATDLVQLTSLKITRESIQEELKDTGMNVTEMAKSVTELFDYYEKRRGLYIDVIINGKKDDIKRPSDLKALTSLKITRESIQRKLAGTGMNDDEIEKSARDLFALYEEKRETLIKKLIDDENKRITGAKTLAELNSLNFKLSSTTEGFETNGMNPDEARVATEGFALLYLNKRKELIPKIKENLQTSITSATELKQLNDISNAIYTSAADFKTSGMTVFEANRASSEIISEFQNKRDSLISDLVDTVSSELKTKTYKQLTTEYTIESIQKQLESNGMLPNEIERSMPELRKEHQALVDSLPTNPLEQIQVIVGRVNSLSGFYGQIDTAMSEINLKIDPNNPVTPEQVSQIIQERRKTLIDLEIKEIEGVINGLDLKTLLDSYPIDRIKKLFRDSGMEENEASTAAATIEIVIEKLQEKLRNEIVVNIINKITGASLLTLRKTLFPNYRNGEFPAIEIGRELLDGGLIGDQLTTAKTTINERYFSHIDNLVFTMRKEKESAMNNLAFSYPEEFLSLSLQQIYNEFVEAGMLTAEAKKSVNELKPDYDKLRGSVVSDIVSAEISTMPFVKSVDELDSLDTIKSKLKKKGLTDQEIVANESIIDKALKARIDQIQILA